MYGLGGGRWSQFCAQSCTREQWSRDHSLFRIGFVVIVAPFCKGRDSIGAHIPVLVTGNIFLQFFPILQPAWLLWCIGRSNSTLREFVCRHGTCLLTKRRSRQHSTVQNGQRSQTCRQYSMQTQGVPNSPFQGLFECTPHTPTYGTLSEHKSGNNGTDRPLKTLRVGMFPTVPERYMGMGTHCSAEKPPMYGHPDTLHYQKAPYIWAWGHFALRKSRLCMGMGTLCTAEKPPMYGHGDTLHFQKAPEKMGMGTLCTAKTSLYVGMGTLCSAKKPPRKCAWGHFALRKSRLCMGMGTLCTAEKPPMYGHGDTLHFPKAPEKMGMGTLCTAKTSLYVGMGTLCSAKKPPIYGHGDTLHCQKAPYMWAWGQFALPTSRLHMPLGTLCTANQPRHPPCCWVS